LAIPKFLSVLNRNWIWNRKTIPHSK